MSRGVKEIVPDFHSSEPKSVSSNDCYMRLVGSVENTTHRENFIKTIDSEETMKDLNEAVESISIMENENTELIFEYMTLHYTFKEENTFVQSEHTKYESYFNSDFYDLMKDKASYEKLEEICRNYETIKSANVDQAMVEHNQRVAKTNSYFIGKGSSQNEAKAAALALSFYTGTKSGISNQDASNKTNIEYRSQRVVIDKPREEKPIEKLIICNYLLRALSKIPYYRGYVTRACSLKDDVLKLYMPGSLIIWTQFNGTFKGKSVLNDFDFVHRNTFFKIYSLTGRPIKTFSNYEDEDEILFLPDSTFLVLKHVASHHGTQHTLYMRQVELGLSTSSILWVDDRIFKDDWNNEEYMTYAEAKDLKKNIRFIQKSNTDNALSFLRSPFGQRLKNRDTFRIVTDMGRDNEQPAYNAGARFIKGIRMLGFNNQCLVFVGNKERTEKIINTELDAHERQFTKVAVSSDDLKSFISFESTL
ncbi:unnamed protein product [Rotaria sordida]|uniref:NAD(P)(+)--arginine ADP-ribosyltransferase n=1 Tax=Rotaria sordida TaxID=392033 RepID=A0A814NQQ5_9BILA|nr:unnamed protein product [Rotaria sordida]